MEVLLTVGLVALILIALAVSVTVSVKNSTFSKSKSLSSKFVNEGIEAARSIRDNDWQTLYNRSSASPGTNNGLTTLAGQWTLSGASDTPATGYTRVVNLVRIGVDTVNVTVTVSWRQGSKTNSSSSTTTFTRWKIQ